MCIALVAMLVMFVFSSMNGRVDLMTRVYGQPLIFFIAALSGSVSVLMLSLFFSIKGRQYSYIGKMMQIPGRISKYIFMSYIPVSYFIASACAILWGFWIYYTYETYWYLLFIISFSLPTSAYFLIKFISSKRKSVILITQ